MVSIIFPKCELSLNYLIFEIILPQSLLKDKILGKNGLKVSEGIDLGKCSHNFALIGDRARSHGWRGCCKADV